MRFFTCLTDDHNLWLVGLAAALCLIGSIITLRLYRRLRVAEKGARLAWAFMGAVATGATIWCTHFVAMIAYEPGVAISYGPVLTGLSLGVAIAGSALALWVASRRMPASAEIGGVLFGLTVLAMHYTGMAAMTIVPVGVVDAGVVGSTNLVLAFAVAAVGLMMLGAGVASHAA